MRGGSSYGPSFMGFFSRDVSGMELSCMIQRRCPGKREMDGGLGHTRSG